MAVAETRIIATMLDPGQLNGTEIGSKWETVGSRLRECAVRLVLVACGSVE